MLHARLQRIAKDISAKNGAGVAELLSFRNWDNKFLSTITDFLDPETFARQTQLAVTTAFRPADPWFAIILQHTRACIALKGISNAILAFGSLKAAATAFLEYVKSETNFWMEPVFELLIKQIRFVAIQADMNEPRNKNLGECLVVYRDFFKVSHQGKQGSLLSVIIGSLCVCFKMRKYDKCTTYITHAPSDLSPYPMRHQVTYNFYSGCIALFNFDVTTALEKLVFAYENCSRKYPKNIRMILEYLIPLRLLEGSQIPSEALLARYSMPEYYSKIIRAYKRGDVHTLRGLIQENQRTLIQKGVYLIYEKVFMLCFRNLFKLTYKILKPEQGVIKMAEFSQAVNLFHDMCIDEVECMVANLIYRKYIRGYIAKRETSSAVKLSSKAFPALPTVFKTIQEDKESKKGKN